MRRGQRCAPTAHFFSALLFVLWLPPLACATVGGACSAFSIIQSKPFSAPAPFTLRAAEPWSRRPGRRLSSGRHRQPKALGLEPRARARLGRRRCAATALPFGKLWSRLPDFYEKYKFHSPRASKCFHVFLRWHSLSPVSQLTHFFFLSPFLRPLSWRAHSFLTPRDFCSLFFALAVTLEFSPSVKRFHSHRVAEENLRDDAFDLFQGERRAGWRPVFLRLGCPPPPPPPSPASSCCNSGRETLLGTNKKKRVSVARGARSLPLRRPGWPVPCLPVPSAHSLPRP